ncbi:MAG TPA: branched-chain amino acid ABC transporter permease [Alphaproteobacteria bacterium]|nr:branched-chain amino acid ABC transporter permease [Alphaproteobacteria bacterium]
MTQSNRTIMMFAGMAALLALVGFGQGWDISLLLLNMCIISAIMALGVNIQWGYAGLFSIGSMGFAALGGLAGVIVSAKPVPGAWQAGGLGVMGGLVAAGLTAVLGVLVWRRLADHGRRRYWLTGLVVLIGFLVIRSLMGPAISAIEEVDPAAAGYLGGMGLPIILSWVVGGLFAAAAAWVVGKVSLGLRSDYLAIATLGISEIIIFILKFEDWLTRGVKNVTGLPRPVPYEVDLIASPAFQDWATSIGTNATAAASIVVKLCYAGLFSTVLLLVLFLSEIALRSPWGRMMRAIRDNETAAEAMGKDVKARHLQVFVLGSTVVGIAGAMLTTLDGQFTPTSYQPLRFTFLIWVMVIIGGSGNNWGAVLGGFVIWFFWIEAEPMGLWAIDLITSGMAEDSALRLHLLDSAAYMRLLTMGLVLLVVLRFAPRGLIPEVKR